ncbi:hypothetical protein ACXDIA_004723 [Klebsiella pneumoniae]
MNKSEGISGIAERHYILGQWCLQWLDNHPDLNRAFGDLYSCLKAAKFNLSLKAFCLGQERAVAVMKKLVEKA